MNNDLNEWGQTPEEEAADIAAVNSVPVRRGKTRNFLTEEDLVKIREMSDKNGTEFELEKKRFCGREYWKRNPEKRQHNNYTQNHGVSYEWFKLEVLKRGGRCDICQQEKGEDLVIDHDHDNGKFRGLLCKACNTAIGLLKEDARLVKTTLDYLNRPL